MINRYIFIILALLVLILSACGGNDDNVEILRPQLSQSSLTINEGETARLTVSSAQQVTAKVSDETVISVNVSGCDILVKALAQGNAVVKIDADGHWLQCPVTVIASDKPYDFTPELSNSKSRYTSQSLSLVYDDTPGVIFTLSHNGIIEILDLDSGANIVFNPGVSEYTLGTLENASLIVNGVVKTLSEAIVERCDNSGVWLNLTVADSCEHIVLVITDL